MEQLLARTRAFILYFSILRFDFGPEKLPGHSRNGPAGSLCFTLTFCTVLICQICEFAESAPVFGN